MTDLNNYLDNKMISDAEALTSTAAICEDAELYGARPGKGEVDHRLAPEGEEMAVNMVHTMECFQELLQNTCFDDELQGLAFNFVNLFHRTIQKIERQLDSNVVSQQRAQRYNDGSEIGSQKINDLLMDGEKLLAKQEFYQEVLDGLCKQYELMTGSPWRPLSGSKMSFSGKTAAILDSGDFQKRVEAKRNQAVQVDGPVILFSGGQDYQDHNAIWDMLDRAKDKHPNMTLVHTGQSSGADMIASKWAISRNIQQTPFKLDRSKGRAAPFKRNESMLALDDIQAAIVCPGTGIQANLIQRAHRARVRLVNLGYDAEEFKAIKTRKN